MEYCNLRFLFTVLSLIDIDMNRILLLVIIFLSGSLALIAQSDDCANAGSFDITAALDCNGSTPLVTGSTFLATPDGVDFTGCIDASVESGVWYSFTAQGPDIAITNLVVGSPQPYVAITDNACPPTTWTLCQQLPIMDADGEGDDVLVTGQIYYMWVGFLGTLDTFALCIDNPEPPANDLCIDAININGNLECVTGTSNTVAGTTEFASPDAGMNVIGCIEAATNSWEGVWYTFTAQGYDFVVEDVGGNQPYVVLVDDCDLTVATLFYCGQVPVDLTVDPHGDNILTPGDTYYMWVGFDGGNEEDFELCIDNPVPPVNDECVNAIDIQNNIHCIVDANSPIQGDIYGALPDFNFGCLPGSGDYEGIWYTFTTEGHDLIIESLGNEDPYIILTDGCTAGSNLIYCGQTPIDLGTTNQANGMPTNNFLGLDDVPMTLYMWVGFDGGLDSTFSICMENPPPPPNDICADAQDISENLDCPNTSVSVPGATIFSTDFFEVGFTQYQWPANAPGVSPDCFDPAVDEAVWYIFEAPGVDLEISDAMGNNPSFAILKYNGCMNGAELIMCDDMPYTFTNEDDPDDLFDVEQLYIMMVAFPGGWQSTDSFDLCINIPIPPPNDLCDNAIFIDDNLDCPEISNPVAGNTTNSSQTGIDYENIDLGDLPCALDTTQDDGIWYRFTAIGTDIEIEDNYGNAPHVVIMEYNSCVDTATVVLCEAVPFEAGFGDPGNNALTIGQEYLMYVVHPGGETANDTFNICIDNDGQCSSPSPPNSYCQTIPICGLSALDAYCLNMAAQPTNETWPGCPSVTLHDPNWFSFVAGSDNLIIEVAVNNCGGQGVHMEMYEIDCTQDIGPDQPFCPATTANLGPPLASCVHASGGGAPYGNGATVTFNAPTEFGHLYAIVIDGWAGDLCTIEIDVVEGGDPPSFDGVDLPEPMWDDSVFPFDGDTICAGATDVEFALQDEVPGACRYNWSINGDPIVDGTNDLIEYIDFPDPGTYEVCVNAGNYCDSTENVCVTVLVAPLTPLETVDTVCEGDPYVWIAPSGEVLTPDPPFNSEEGGDYEYTTMLVTGLGCEIEGTLYMHIREENDDNPTQIDSAICSYDAPFEFYGQIIAIPNSGVLEQEDVMIPFLSHNGLCDSFFTIDAVELDVTLTYDGVPPIATCTDSIIEVCPSSRLYKPDPDTYPEVDVTYVWRLASSDSIVSDGMECLHASVHDFIDREELFELEVYMQYDGMPSDPCLFGTFDVILDLDDFLPDTLMISGPDTVCIDNEAEYTLAPFDLTRPAADFVRWDLDGMPGAEVAGPPGDFARVIRFNEAGVSGEICVQAVNGCYYSPWTCKEITVTDPPVAYAGADDEECTDTYELMADGIKGLWIVVDAPTGAFAPVFSDSSSASSSVSVIQKGIYTFGWILGDVGCRDTAEVSINFISPMLIDGDTTFICDAISENYTVSFDVIGGLEPLSVSSANGTINGVSFTSDPVPTGDDIIVIIEDANGCLGTFVFNYICDCLTETATMSTELLEGCGTDCLQATHMMDSILDANDIIRYVLHDRSDDILGNVVAENTSGSFCFSSALGMQYDQTYYVSMIAGNELSGSVDLDHPCTQIAFGQPFIWYEQPVSDAGTNDATCILVDTLNAQSSAGSGQWYQVSPVTGATFEDPQSPVTEVSVNVCGTYVFRWIEDNNLCRDSADVSIEFYCAPQLGSIIQICNDTQTEIELTSFDIEQGTEPFIELNGRGMIDGNVFSIGNLPLNQPDTFYIIDANGCELEVHVPGYNCVCVSAVGTLTSDFLNACVTDCVPFVYDSTGEFLDGNDTLRFIIHDTEDTIVGNVYAMFDGPLACFEPSTMSCDSIYYIAAVVGNQVSSGVDLNDICLRVSAGQPIKFDCMPVSDAGADQIGCSVTNFEAIASRGIGQWSQISGDPAIITDPSDPASLVTMPIPGVYCFEWEEVYDLCSDRDTVCITYEDAPEFVLDTIIGCNLNNTDYQVRLLIDGGDPSTYIVEGNGTRNGNVFTSDEIPSQDPYFFVVYDQYDCRRDTVMGTHDCGCITQVGELAGGPFYLCEDDVLDVNPLYDDALQFLDGNDQLVFILHDGTASPLGNPLRVNTSGLFDLGTLDLGTTYYISVVVGDESGGGNVDLTSRCLSVSNPIELSWFRAADFTISPSDPEITCLITQILLTANSSDNLDDYDLLWSTSNGNIEAGDETLPQARINSQGTYTLTIKHKLAGCESSQQITIDQSADVPVVVIQDPNDLTCVVEEIQLSAVGSSEGSSISYQWSGPGIVGSDTSLVITVDRPGLYTLTITDSSNGCVISGNKQVNEDIEAPNAEASTSELIDCNTTQILVSGAGSDEGANYTYSWSIITPGGHIVGSTNTRDIMVDEVGTYEIAVTNTVNGCISTATALAEEDNNVIMGAEIVVTQPGCDTKDDGRIVIQSVIGGTPPFNYSFDGGISFMSQGFADNLSSGTYDIVITDGNGCIHEDVIVLDEPFDFFLDLGETIVVDYGDTALVNALTDLPDSLIRSMSWSPLLDTANANELYQEFIPDLGQITVGLVLTNTNGCVREDRVLVVTTFSESIYIPNVIYPGSDNEPNRVFYIYADPFKVTEISSLAVYDRWGERVFERTDIPPSLTLDQNYAWDGIWKGEPSHNGVYVYYAEVEFVTGVRKTIKGDFSLIR
jgi:hypothetical protein